MKTIRVALTGGGSGGHIYPLAAVSEELERISIDKKVLMEIKYFGSAGVFEEVLENAGVKINRVVSGKVRRQFSFLNFVDAPKILIGFFQALFKLFFFMPDVLFSKGGTGAFPVVLAAWFYRIPVLIHESDAKPGLNNLFSARFAKCIAVSFEKALEYFDPKKTACVGSPVRKHLLDNRPTAEAAKEKLGFDPGRQLVVFLGGSQGAKPLNDLILVILKNLAREIQVLHQTGTGNFAEVDNFIKSTAPEILSEQNGVCHYRLFPYLDLTGMKLSLSAADLVVARAGSNIFEIAAFSKPALLVPLGDSANDHQRINAYEFEKAGGGIVIEEINLLPGVFFNEISNLLKNKETLNKMSIASGNFFKPQAAEVLAEEIMRLAR